VNAVPELPQPPQPAGRRGSGSCGGSGTTPCPRKGSNERRTPISGTEPISLDARRGQTDAVLPKALYRITETMALLSMSRTVIYEQIRCGRLRTVKQGASRLVPHAAIAEYVALLERESEERAA